VLLKTLVDALDFADADLCDAMETVRKLAASSTWQGCAETTEQDVLLYGCYLLQLRSDLLRLRRVANGEESLPAIQRGPRR
jgi:hypothetical protein